MASDMKQILALFTGTAGLRKAMPGYESRPGQVRMVKEVAAALAQGQVAIIEAGTGTGKSLAYLIPAAVWARETGNRVVISTHTLNLQEQLIGKDIPMAERLLGPIKAMMVKGRGNYICWRRYQDACADLGRIHPAERAVFMELMRNVPNMQYGSRSEFAANIPDGLWESIASQSETCLRGFCPYERLCFIQKLRRDAAASEITVVNHHLLLADIAITGAAGGDGGVLPPYGALVIDEAHHMEDIATEYFGREADSRAWQRLWEELYRRQGRSFSGLLVSLRDWATKLDKAPERTRWLQCLDESFDPVLRAAECGSDWFNQLAQTAAERGLREGGENRLRLIPAIRETTGWPHLMTALENLESAASIAAARLRAVLSGMKNADVIQKDERAMAMVVALEAAVLQAEATVTAAGEMLTRPPEGRAVWIERPGRGITRLVERPLSVSEPIYGKILEPLKSVILTSATLATGGSLEYWAGRIGADRIRRESRREAVIPSPFNYRDSLLLTVPMDMPEPDSSVFLPAAAEYLSRVVRLSRGRAFLLFTSYGMLTEMHGRMRDELAGQGLDVLRQGEADRGRILQWFKESGKAVLFATSSFWEGVDVPGDALSCVVLAKLPFPVPSEPLYEARAEEITKRGGNPFGSLSLPHAVLRFKQGFGRLIRRGDDRGAVVVLDRRLVTRQYGQAFLNSLPDCTRHFGPAKETLIRLSQWFEPGP